MAAISPDLTQSCQRRSAKGLANAINFHFDFLVRKCILGFCCCCNISHFHSRFRNACGSHTLTHSERARSCILNHIWYLHTKCICAQRSTTINIVNTYTYAFFSIFFSVFFFSCDGAAAFYVCCMLFLLHSFLPSVCRLSSAGLVLVFIIIAYIIQLSLPTSPTKYVSVAVAVFVARIVKIFLMGNFYTRKHREWGNTGTEGYCNLKFDFFCVCHTQMKIKDYLLRCVLKKQKIKF